MIGPAIADALTGQYAAMAILAALLERAGTGKGRRIDISMLEAMTHFNLDSFTHYFAVDEVMGPLSRPTVSQSYTFECADGKWVAIHMSSPAKFWEGLLAATGQGQLAEDSAFCRTAGAHRTSGRSHRNPDARLQGRDARSLVRKAA
nr:CoA transferase [Marinicella sp. W31]MDC2876158.1 CoA transferase [Marinicella sp. W31]